MDTHSMSFLTVTEMAEFLRIGRSSAYELCHSNELPVVRIGKTIRIPKKGLEKWIEGQAQQNARKEHWSEQSFVN